MRYLVRKGLNCASIKIAVLFANSAQAKEKIGATLALPSLSPRPSDRPTFCQFQFVTRGFLQLGSWIDCHTKSFATKSRSIYSTWCVMGETGLCYQNTTQNVGKVTGASFKSPCQKLLTLKVQIHHLRNAIQQGTSYHDWCFLAVVM